MISETGKVIAIDQVDGNLVARVECISKSACSSCHNNTSCGVGVVSKAFSDKTQHFQVPFETGMKVDHFVELQISNGDLVKSAALIYLLPLFFFIGSALLLKVLFSIEEGALIVISTLMAALGFFITRSIVNKVFPQQHNQQIITTKIIEY